MFQQQRLFSILPTQPFNGPSFSSRCTSRFYNPNWPSSVICKVVKQQVILGSCFRSSAFVVLCCHYSPVFMRSNTVKCVNVHTVQASQKRGVVLCFMRKIMYIKEYV